MTNSLSRHFALALSLLILTTISAEAKSVIAGDIILSGAVERFGRQLTGNASVFEGDSIRTQKASGAVLRVASGRVEISELSEVEIIRRSPLTIAVKAGSIAFAFPKDTALDIITPQLEVQSDADNADLSGIVIATADAGNRVLSRQGNFTVIERHKDGSTNHIMPGQILIAAMLPVTPAADPQGRLTGPQIAVIQAPMQGDVQVARASAVNNFVRVAQQGTGLANGDFVRTMNGRANILFTDQSVITLSEGTTVQIQERMLAGSVSRRITQYIGNLWFNITKVTGTETTLETPTAVAAIRGTQGTQEVPNDNQSTHALNEGVEQITEIVTQQSVTINSGQRVTAIRGIGFTPIVALVAAITQPSVTAGGPAGGGAGAGAATATSATVSTVVTVAAVATAGAAVTAGVLGPALANGTPPAASASQP